MVKTSESHPIRVDFVKSDAFPVLHRLGMTFAPGKCQNSMFSGVWERDLKADLGRLREVFRADTLVSLVEDFELAELKIPSLVEECEAAGIRIVRFPIRDVSVPVNVAEYEAMVRDAAARLTNGETILVHCKGGLGRAGMTAACIAVAATGMQGRDAVGLVREFRKGTVETAEQEAFVINFKPSSG